MGMIAYPKTAHPDFACRTLKPAGRVLFEEGFKPVFAWLGDKDLVTGVSTDESTNAGYRITDFGKELHFNGTANDQVEWTLGTTGNYTEATVVLILNPDAPTGNDIVFSTNNAPSSFVGGLSIWADNNGFETGVTNCFSINFQNNPGRMETAANTVVAGQFTTLVVEYRQDRVSSCVNGRFKTSMDTGSVPSTIEFSTVRVGGMNHLNDYKGGVLGVVVFDHALSRNQIYRISVDPFRTLFKPADPLYHFTSSALNISPASITTLEAFGSASLSSAVNLSLTGIASQEAFGSSTVDYANQAITPGSIVSAEAFGAAVLSASASISPDGISSAENFGSHVVSAGSTILTPSAISSAEAFGAAVLSALAGITPSSIGSAEAFGDLDTDKSFEIQHSSISSAEAFGSLSMEASFAILAQAIASNENFGGAVIGPGTAFVVASGIPTEEIFGAAITYNAGAIFPVSIETLETFGNPTLTPGAVTILPSGIESGEEFGIAFVGEVLVVGKVGIVKKIVKQVTQSIVTDITGD